MAKPTGKDRLRELRSSLGTQQQVADELGLVRATISRYEQLGDDAPRWYWLALAGLKVESLE